MFRSFVGVVLLWVSLVALPGCSSSQVRVPSSASVAFHGPMQDMTGSMPPGPGMMYVVDAATNHVVGAFYVPSLEEMKAGQKAGMGGLEQGKTYTFYFAPSAPGSTPPTTAKSTAAAAH